ncbi:MAG: hypothetical protein EHM38_01190 [Geobacteraceae bacterium]|nr:MAG: hypothetical protein EHM38_01190 [Geobacteraceae bacterium]
MRKCNPRISRRTECEHRETRGTSSASQTRKTVVCPLLFFVLENLRSGDKWRRVAQRAAKGLPREMAGQMKTVV